MTYLMQLPGFGVITATPALACGASVTILAAIGDVQRFASSKHLASYSGLTPGLEQSGFDDIAREAENGDPDLRSDD